MYAASMAAITAHLWECFRWQPQAREPWVTKACGYFTSEPLGMLRLEPHRTPAPWHTELELMRHTLIHLRVRHSWSHVCSHSVFLWWEGRQRENSHKSVGWIAYYMYLGTREPASNEVTPEDLQLGPLAAVCTERHTQTQLAQPPPARSWYPR